MQTANENISGKDYARLQQLIYSECGINLNDDKKVMLELRIRRRLRLLNLDSFGAYCAFLFSDRGRREELSSFLDVVTTNKTDFFREPEHFRFLEQHALPDFWARNKNERAFHIWSAGCSSGEEPYTMAIVLSEFAEKHPGFRFQILASDLSTAMLEKAEKGIYPGSSIKPVPAAAQRKYFMRSRDRGSELVRVVPELRAQIEFMHLNFKDHDYRINWSFDAFFCRNVIIYFDRATQEEILGRLTRLLLPGGYAFMGHSETLHGMDLPLEPVAPSLYRRVHA